MGCVFATKLIFWASSYSQISSLFSYKEEDLQKPFYTEFMAAGQCFQMRQTYKLPRPWGLTQNQKETTNLTISFIFWDEADI